MKRSPRLVFIVAFAAIALGITYGYDISNIAGGAGVFIVFGILCVLAFGFVARFSPETKGRDLSQITTYWANGAQWPENMKAS